MNDTPPVAGKNDSTRTFTITDPPNEKHGGVARDDKTGKRLRLCYICGRPDDEHTPNCPQLDPS